MSNAAAVVIIGFDPGLGTTGFGVISARGSKITALDYGVARTTPHTPLPARLVELQVKVRALLAAWKPDRIGLERLVVGANLSNVINVTQARGVLLAECAAAGAPIIELTPAQVKRNVTGYGQAAKGQLNRLLKAQLGITATITPDDASDALAVAVAVSAYRT